MIEPVLLKSGPGEFGAILFIVISIISWLVNYIKEQKKPQRRPQRPAPQQQPRAQQRQAQQRQAQQQRQVPAQQHLQNEIDLFLQKTGGRRQAAEPIIEILPEDEFEFQSQPRRLVGATEHIFDSNLEDRHLAEKNLGSNIRQHVSTHAGSNELDVLVDSRMDNRVGGGVLSHLGSFSGDAVPKASTRSEIAKQIFRLFQTPQGVQQAIIMKEVLTRRKFS